MKTFFSRAILVFSVLGLNAPPAGAQSGQIQSFDGMMILPSTYGDLICLENWNNDLGRCDGPAVSSGALAAISAEKSADKLEEIRLLLDSINRGISANTQALLDIQKSGDLQEGPDKESVKQAIGSRFDAIPPAILTDDSVKKEIAKLKKDILLELDKIEPKPAGGPEK